MNRKLVLMPAVLATAVMVGCNSDSDGPSGPGETEPHLTNLLVKSTNATKLGNQYRLPAAFPIQFTATAVYSDQSTKIVTTEASWEATENLSSSEYFLEKGEFFALFHADEPETVTVSYGGEVVDVLVDVEYTQLENIEAEGPVISLVGLSTPYQAIAHFDNDLTLDITSFVGWESDNDAEFTRDGVAEFLEVGFDTISAQYLDTTQSITPFEVEVVEGTVDDNISMTITGPNTITVGRPIKLTATMTLNSDTAGSHNINATEIVSWKSSCAEITVDAIGVANASDVAIGCDINATYYSSSDEITNTKPHTVRAVEAGNETKVVRCEKDVFYDHTYCKALLLDENEQVVSDLTEASSWTSNNATISAGVHGYVTSKSVGEEATITASSSVDSASSNVRVGFLSGDLTLESDEIYVGGVTQLLAFSGEGTDRVDVTELVDWNIEASSDNNWELNDNGAVTVDITLGEGETSPTISASWVFEDQNYKEQTNVLVVPVDICADWDDISCLQVTEHDGLQYASTPSKSLVDALSYTQGTGDGRVFRDYQSSASYNAPGFDIASGKSTQYSRWCNDLNYMNVNGASAWRPVTADELLVLHADHDGVVGSWPLDRNYWAFDGSEYSTVDMKDGKVVSGQGPQHPQYLVCVAD
ncbi:hypothetical protein GT360_03885 [Vibrio astriarenae]|uniref:Uncharacterized protein n=1 Tax=Vibrio astriarenae TaxID=1481923 RepID=A0A7Z2YCV7_9VIBR|nr:hypothetical protein [Vibrio astriarenae]QIA62703.1 hypothetical protein GT360_03885 [Vibrio astriarenae]